MHAAEPAGATSPRAQGRQPRPSAEAVALGHTSQRALAASGCSPGAHGVHVSLAAAACVPLGHVRHDFDSASARVPAAHMTQRSVSGTKPATLETGAIVKVPMFIETGELIKVDTREDRYISRASGDA